MEKTWSSDFELREDVVLHSLPSFQDWVKQQSFKPNAVVLLSGPMGLGKTEFVKTWIQSKTSSEKMVDVASPSFAIHHSYSVQGQKIHHFDLYRIQGSLELEGTGFWDILSSVHQVTFIEWPERVDESEWPLDRFVYLYQFQAEQDPAARRVLKKIRLPYL
jgi:tRNA threonylcarbamoyl adenosine modification protein YjeE